MALIYYTGQDVGVTVTVTDDTGAPVSGPVSVSLAVTDPSGAVTSPATVATGGGAYSAVVPSVSAEGVWLYRWTATGTGVGFAAEGQFQVRPVGVEQLVDLASVKAHLGMRQDDTRQDDELQGFILAAADLARDHCGPFLPETHTQFFDGGVSCRGRFSERKGTPLYRCRLPEETAVAIFDHLAEGNGVRQTSRLVGVQPNTVVRLAFAAGQHAHDAHDELVAFSPGDPRGPIRREVVLRRQEAEELRSRQPGR